MSDLLKGIKTKKSPASNISEPTSLASLILEDNINITEDEVSPQAEREPVPSSRKNRRKKLKTSRVVNRKVEDPGKKARKRAEQRRQERNVRNLLDRQKENSNRPKNNSDMFIPSPRNRSDQETSIPNVEESSALEVLRPVLLGSVEYHPIWKDGKETPAGTLLKLKRAARRIKVDKQVPVSLGNVTFTEPSVTTSLAQYSKSNKLFYESLSPKNISEYEAALAAFGLVIEDGASATEVLYTLASEYSKALRVGSSRLDESSDREIESGTTLIPPKDEKIERYAAALKKTTSKCYDALVDADDDDLEISLKCLLTLLSKEVMLAYNSQRSGIDVNTLWARNLYSTATDKNALSSPARLKSGGSLTKKTANGVCFSNNISGNVVYNYPFELSAIISPGGTQAKSSSNFIDDLISPEEKFYPGIDSSGEIADDVYTDPFSATASRYQYASDSITKLYDTSTFGTADLYSISFVRTILKKVATVAQFSALIPNIQQMLVLHTFVEAAENKDFFDWLIIYLAFRQERYEGYSGAGSPPVGPSSVVRKSSRINKRLYKLGSAKKKTTSKVNPRTISISPEPGESSGTKTFESPERASTITTEDAPVSGDAGTLESIYGESFEEIAARFASKLLDRFKSNGVGFSEDISKQKVVALSSIESALSSITLSSFETLFDYSSLISADLPDIDDSEPEVFVSGKSAVSAYNEDAYSIAYIMVVCKLTKLLLSGKSTCTANSPIKKSSLVKASVKSTPTYAKTATAVKKHSTSGSGSTSTKEKQAYLRFSNDYSDKLREIADFLSSSEEDTADIIDSYPTLSAIMAGLSEEERFLSSFCESLSLFFSQARDRYLEVKDVLLLEAGGMSLKEYLASGQSISSDVVKAMKSYSYSLNCSDMSYNGRKLRDKVTGRDGYRLIKNVLKNAGSRYVSPGNKNVLCVGIPAGLLEKMKYEPAEIEDISGFSTENFDESRFFVVIEKIDLADPEVKYKDLEFEFSRDLFCLGADPWASFLKVGEDFVCKKLNRVAAEKEFSSDVMANHLVDTVMKQYMDLQYGMNFSELEFTNMKRENVTSEKLVVPALEYLDTSSKSFMSSSNLAYDPRSRSIDNFKFYSGNEISIADVNMSDVYEYSMFEYLTSYGNLFVPESESKNLETGLVFEKVLCIPISDDDFVIDFDDDVDDPQPSVVSAAIQARLRSQDEVGLGLETSQGVDMYTYRVSLRVGGEES